MFECKSCHQGKTESEFYKNRGVRMGKCKECVKAGVRARRLETIDERRAYDRARSLLPHRQEMARKRSNMYAKPASVWRTKNEEKYKAHSAVSNALRDGKMMKPLACEACAREVRLQGHHDDYSKPLEVIWLCAPCHGERHRWLNELKRRAA